MDDNLKHVTIPSVSLAFSKRLAGTPVWHYSPAVGTRYQIPYLLAYEHNSAIPSRPIAQDLSLLDTPPEGFSLDVASVRGSAGEIQRELDPLGNLEVTLVDESVRVGDRGWVKFQATQDTATLNYGDPVVNRAVLGFNLMTYSLIENVVFTSTVGIAPPLISFPHTGELCPGEFRVKGIAMPGTEVSIVNANGGQELATAMPDADWNFTSTPIDASLPLKLQAMSCTPDGENCSAWSRPVYLFLSTGGWCPQNSRWEGTVKYGPLAGTYQRYDFKSRNGSYSTRDWQIGGVYGFNDTDLTLVGCPCTELGASRQITVVADGVTYTPVSVSGNQFRFRIGGAHNVKIISSCGDDKDESPGVVLIDPDGFVFDAHEGGEYDTATGVFDPVRAIPGVTVTCMMSAPEQGGWIPWPAHVYSQTNPQVTDASYPDGITTTGYYAFFTPPGHYYIQVDGVHGYQPWRSPVVEVITQIVHVNVPYTPLPPEAVRTVTLTPDGPDPSVVTVSVGSAVEWRSELRATDTVSDLITWFENPVLHLESDLDVLLDTDGWDAGYLEPGRTYRRKFIGAGTYTYTDALGHVGTVVVEPAPLYLPVVMRQ
jgi:plastocyanin